MSIPRYVFEQTVASLFAPVAPFLEGDEVSEIMINGHDEIYVEKRGRLHLTGHEFASEHALMSALRNLSQFVGRELSARQPILEARLPDGSRVEAIIPPAATSGPVVCIRRFRRERLTLDRLVGLGSACPATAGLLREILARKDNVVVAGGSGSGKTSLLNALASLAPNDQRVVVIEDSQELQLGLPHVVHLEAQPADARGKGGVTIRELLRATLRMRPDRIVIGEIRGGEALDLIQAMTSGHRGCLSTVHATLPIDTLNRLETMALMGDVAVPIDLLRTQIASAIDTIVQVSRLPDGSRRVTHISEVRGYDRDTGYRLTHSFERSESFASAE
ncbi:MAG: CpaF family protein [Deltaproteobacteria bacterium]|nr:CpaF family protein [Deltaproteobacteria bacterium]MBW2188484.1 CpaF family protein [Deltaproteobacteria bacterium]MBW2222816.1 CpaF family protein [Deltaproteobacteria bacterium]MBW2402476.1 CpaF family protein [Deltaproteobacteria bacterium]MBW2545798.1 CpaF family protein [Deltaproteobacteria bacterium]